MWLPRLIVGCDMIISSLDHFGSCRGQEVLEAKEELPPCPVTLSFMSH